MFIRFHMIHELYVRPSVTFVDHVKTNKHIFEIFLPSGSYTILDEQTPHDSIGRAYA